MNFPRKRGYIIFAAACLMQIATQSGAQVPLPGQGQASSGYPPAPQPGPSAVERREPASQPPSYNRNTRNEKSNYQSLPLNVNEARLRLTELRTLLAVSRPQDVQDRIYNMCEWLGDMADAHWRLSQALGKGDATRTASLSERSQAIKFSNLKHEAWLLKAELLIKQNRVPEALGPLVDIVVAEPKSSTGLAAYEKLKEIGFSEDSPEALSDLSEALKQPPPAAPKPKVPKAVSIR